MAQSPLAPWRDASIILLALPAFILSLVPVAILYFSNRGMHWVLTHARTGLRTVSEKADLAGRYVTIACDKIAWPFIAAYSTIAGVQAGGRALWRILRRKGKGSGDDAQVSDGMIGGTL